MRLKWSCFSSGRPPMRTTGRRLVIGFVACGCVLLETARLPAQRVPVEEHVLENGLRLLLVPRPGSPNIAAGWIARVGSVNERPGITGIAHLFEHMMFKGTHVIGTRDLEKNREVMAQLDAVREELAREDEAVAEKLLRGELDDAPTPEQRTPRHNELLQKFRSLNEAERELTVKDEFDRVYSAAGASGMNAGTTRDFTVYFINVPTNKLELWFWMESDRLLNPVFREFYTERDVVREERRMRVESTPTGRLDEQFEALFWKSSPYGWPVIGWPSDVEAISREEALGFFSVYYAPNNLSACLVGDFDPKVALALAERYFGRLRRGPREPSAIRTTEVEPLGEVRFSASAETSPQVKVRYHTVAEGHRDEYALSLLGDVLSGRTGRLYKSLVLDQKIATQTTAYQRGSKFGGYFEMIGVGKPGEDLAAVEAALDAELDELRTGLVGERELQKVKNQVEAAEFRRLRADFSLMLELLIREAYRGWETITTDSEKLQAVTAEDIQRVAKRYLVPERRVVATYTTKTADTSRATTNRGEANR